MTHLSNIEKLANTFNNDVELVKKQLKSLQSQKTRLKKQKGIVDYDKKMTDLLQKEQALKEVRALLDPKEKPVTHYDQTDVSRLDYDETIKAIKSIQSKKTLSRWLTAVEGDNDEYRNACKIEKMLLEHKKQVQPVDESYIRKSDLVTIIDTIESSGELSQARIVEMLKGLL